MFLLHQGKSLWQMRKERYKRVEQKRVYHTDSKICSEMTNHSPKLAHPPKPFHVPHGLSESLLSFVCLENSYSSFKTHLKHHLLQIALITPLSCYPETLYIHALLFFTFAPFTLGGNTCLLIGLPHKLWGLQRLGSWVSFTFISLVPSRVPSTKEGVQ